LQHSFLKNLALHILLLTKKIDLILNLWASSLITSDLNISSLGSFKINQKNSRLGRNPKTKEEHVIKSRKVISFKKSKNLEI
jgi:integration host factor subunit alpha